MDSSVPGSRERRKDAVDPVRAGMTDGTWWVYMIECRGGRIYTGIAKDPGARFREHLSGKGAAFTRMNPPVALLAKRPCGTRSDALRAERALRRFGGREKRAWAKEQGDLPSSRLPGEKETTENGGDSVRPGRRRPGGEKAP
jgi:putative endonuclease